MTIAILTLKLTLAPSLVATATAVARRLGHRFGGLVGGLPVVAAPILLIYALEHGDVYARRAAQGTVLGIVSLVAFCVVYVAASTRVGWLSSILAGWAAFLGSTALFALKPLPLGGSALLAALAVGAASLWLGARSASSRSPHTGAGRDLLVWRLLATAAMVVTLTTLSGSLSPWVGGLLAPFPIITAVLAGFTHAQNGPGAASQMLAGLVPGLASFTLFFAVLALAMGPFGVAGAFALATAGALCSHGGLAVAIGRGSPAPLTPSV